MSVLIKGLKMPETEYVDVRIFQDGTAAIATGTKPYYRELKAEPVRHGKWELADDGWYCSACELYPPFDCDPEEKGIPYCPYCGARMVEE